MNSCRGPLVFWIKAGLSPCCPPGHNRLLTVPWLAQCFPTCALAPEENSVSLILLSLINQITSPWLMVTQASLTPTLVFSFYFLPSPSIDLSSFFFFFWYCGWSKMSNKMFTVQEYFQESQRVNNVYSCLEYARMPRILAVWRYKITAHTQGVWWRLTAQSSSVRYSLFSLGPLPHVEL